MLHTLSLNKYFFIYFSSDHSVALMIRDKPSSSDKPLLWKNDAKAFNTSIVHSSHLSNRDSSQ